VKKTKVPTHVYSAHARAFRPFSPAGVGSAIISSVVPVALSRVLVSLSRLGLCRTDVVGRDVVVPVRNRYRRKGEVGQDRLVNSYAAVKLYGAPAVIVDFGTAITFDVVSARREYMGGLILPGIAMGLRSLYEKTALLPLVELKRAKEIIGRDTVESMRGGILFGYGALVDGLCARYIGMLGKRTRIIATGGDAGLVSGYSRAIQAVDEDLTLKGLAELSRNRSSGGA
jgi:type III pantothenate kinase